MVRPWEQKCSVKPPPGITAADLIKRTFEPTKFAVDGLLPEGLTVLAGGPKHGKSWLSLRLAWAVAGGNTLDGRAVNRGDVLYLALEDTQRRLQNRLKVLQPSLGWEFPKELMLQTQWVRADDGGLALIAEWLESHKTTAKLVIIDTLAKFRKPQKGNGNSYADDYEAIGGFKELIDHYSVSGLLIHHTRKLKSEDPFEELSGTQAIMGAADTTMVLDRIRGAGTAKLFATGRDLDDITIPMTFHKDSGMWSLGESVSGIDTEGRGTGVEKSANKVEQCKVWLREFLAEFAYPSGEITEAGRLAGFTFATIKDTKAALGRNGTGEVFSKKFGEKEWWSGLGDPLEWKLRDGNKPAQPSEPTRRRHRKDTGEGDDEGI